MDHNSRDQPSTTGALEVDYDNIINKLTSLISVVKPCHASILDTSDLIHAPNSVTTDRPQQHLKLDGEVCQMLSSDIERTDECNDQIGSILRNFLDFAGAESKGAGPTASTRIEGETARLAATTQILDTFTKLEWLACICQENSVAVSNLSVALESGHRIWNLFPKAIYSSLDCMIQLTILWKLFGGYIDLQALASGKSNAVLTHDNPQVVHAKNEVSALLEMRKKMMGFGPESEAPVPVTEILSTVILPVMKATKERLL